MERDVRVPMRDGVTLSTDVYRPAHEGKLPVLIERLPYGKDSLAARLFLDPSVAARHGYVVLVQDCRGRFASEGEWYPFRFDKDDGYDAIEWAAAQPWSNGRVGMFGGSGHGSTQWLAATTSPPHLVTMAPMTAPCRPHNSWIYRSGGAFALNSALGWSLSVAVDFVRRSGRKEPLVEKVGALFDAGNESDSWAKLDAARAGMRDVLDGLYAHRLPLADWDLIDELAPWFRDWVDHSEPDDPYWEDLSFLPKHAVKSAFSTIQVTGWYDFFLDDVIASHGWMSREAATPEARESQKLIIGPWVHGAFTPTTTRSGDLDFGPSAGIDLTDVQLEWFDHQLRNEGSGLPSGTPIRLFVMGANTWRDEWEWPLERTRWTRLFLQSGGRANTRLGDGRLGSVPPGRAGADHYVFTPDDPVPTHGGVVHPMGLEAGAFDQSEIEMRADVLVYSTGPLTQDLEVTGPISVELWASSSAPATDFAAKLVDVHPDGRAFNLCEGILSIRSLTSDEIHELTIDLWACSNVFLAGHRIRLEITSSNWPHFEVNANSGKTFGHDGPPDLTWANQTIHHGPATPSCVVLPVIPRTSVRPKGNSMLPYRELLERSDAPRGSSWGLFGENDEIGTINHLTPERVLKAMSLVRRGDVFNLDYPINTFGAISPTRKPAQHNIFQLHPGHRDDFLQDFYLQGTTQIDGLRHRRHHEHGFYNWTSDDDIAVGSPRLGVNNWADRGIVGRGVLVDIERHLRRQGRAPDHENPEPFSTDLVDEAAAAQGVVFRAGDILLLRTGWTEFLLNELNDKERIDYGSRMVSPGLIQSEQTLAWLWDHGFALAAADNLALEAFPPIAESPYGKGDRGLMHEEIIAMLGLPIGELWKLDDLARDCDSDRTYEFAVVAKPLNLVGGVGTPANAIAIR